MRDITDKAGKVLLGRTAMRQPTCLDDRYSTTRLVFQEQGAGAADGEVPFAKNVSSFAPSEFRTTGLRAKGNQKRDTLHKPLVTVVTVVFDSAEFLERTVRSVLHQSYDNVEYIIIDGGSTDGTLSIIQKYGDAIDYWVSEPDKGIYDAMNKGLQSASGQWVNFMNSGDVFASRDSIADTVAEFSDAMVYYSDTIFYFESGGVCYSRQVTCDAQKHQFIHQSCIYRKELHSTLGLYLVAKGVTASDYLFFKSIPHEYWQKTRTIISKYHVGNNASSGRRHDEQVLGADLFFGGRSIKRTFASYYLNRVRGRIRKMQECILPYNLYQTRIRKYSGVPCDVFWQETLGAQNSNK